MLKIFAAEDNRIDELERIQPGSWVALTNPTQDELDRVKAVTKIDMDALKAALDEEERSRIETEDEYQMVIADVPVIEEDEDTVSYFTIPMSVIITENYVVTVCLRETPILTAFMHGRVKNFYTRMKTRFIFQILYRNASLFLQYLRSIERRSEIIEKKLGESATNDEIIQLLELEKSLLYFTTSLKSNEIVLEKLLKTDAIKKYPEDTDLLEDVIIENKQAIEMAGIYTGILSDTRDAFASVSSNNLNNVMRFLAVVTIVMSIPTMIFSAYGMNLNQNGMPFADSPWGFAIIIGLCIVVSMGIALLFSKKKFFK